MDDLQAGQIIDIVFDPNDEVGDQGVLEAVKSLSEIELIGCRSASGNVEVAVGSRTARRQRLDARRGKTNLQTGDRRIRGEGHTDSPRGC